MRRILVLAVLAVAPAARGQDVPSDPAPGAAEQSSAYLEVGLRSREVLNYYGDSPDEWQFNLGFHFQADFRVVSGFMLGSYFEFLDVLDTTSPVHNEAGLVEVGLGLRLGWLLPLGERLLLVPFGQIGLTVWRPVECDNCSAERFGVRFGAGLDVRIMLVPWLALAVNLNLGYDLFPGEYNRNKHRFDFGPDLGLVFAF